MPYAVGMPESGDVPEGEDVKASSSQPARAATTQSAEAPAKQPDLDAFDWEEDFETIPWSVSYVAICMLLPITCGALSSFCWSGRGEKM